MKLEMRTGGGIEVVGDLWVLIISIASLRARALIHKVVNLIGLVVGVCGIVTVMLARSELGAIFGLLQIVWFFAVGAVLLRAHDAQQVASTAPELRRSAKGKSA